MHSCQAVLDQAIAAQKRSNSASPLAALRRLLDERDALLNNVYLAAGLTSPPSLGEVLKAARPSLPVEEEAEFWVRDSEGEAGSAEEEASSSAGGGDLRAVRRTLTLDVAPDRKSLLIRTREGAVVYDERVARREAGLAPLPSDEEIYKQGTEAAGAASTAR